MLLDLKREADTKNIVQTADRNPDTQHLTANPNQFSIGYVPRVGRVRQHYHCGGADGEQRGSPRHSCTGGCDIDILHPAAHSGGQRETTGASLGPFHISTEEHYDNGTIKAATVSSLP